jgi:hypothetical protein
LPSLGTANTEDNLVNEQSVNDNAINQNISQIVPEYVLCEQYDVKGQFNLLVIK